MVKSEVMGKPAVRKAKWYDKYVKNWDLILLVLPALILLAVFKYGPLYGLLIAFKDFRFMDGIWGSKWVGLEHFVRLFTQNDFMRVFGNTVKISLLNLIIGFPPPVILALLINEVKHNKFKKVVQTLTYLPQFFSWVVMSGIVMMIFSTTGPINDVITAITGKPIEFFANGKWFIFLLVFTNIWKTMGWSSILFLAAITGIDESLFEAATVDGAGKFKQIIHITLPCILPTMITVFLVSLGTVLNSGFDQIYNMYNPVVYDVADIVDTYVIRVMQSGDYSVSAAAGMFKSVVSLVFVVSANAVVNKVSDGQYGIF